HGADAMRWYLLSSSILRGSDFAVTDDGMRDTVRQVMLPLWNSWYFLSLYANAESVAGIVDASSENVLDRYIISKLHGLVASTTKSFDEYDLFAACAEIRIFLDALTNWYIRRSRDRFWKGDVAAINTLHTVLHYLTRIAAPVLPLVSEQIFRGLSGERSVHLQSWPTNDGLRFDEKLVASMDRVRDVCSTTLSLRKAHGRRVRQPLASLTVATQNSAALKAFEDIIKDEVNVRSITFSDDVSSVAEFELQVVPSVVGPRLGANTQAVIKAVKKGEWTRQGDVVTVGGIDLNPGEYQLKLVPKASGASAALGDSAGVIVLDIELTAELEAEGVAHSVVGHRKI
ncbi:MAG: isoleucine--tRNA ligase, partial [Acidimicrobiia bacterium]|nr:isoleucine--tRNA ligase [Acidimicrobiia bacterium]